MRRSAYTALLVGAAMTGCTDSAPFGERGSGADAAPIGFTAAEETRGEVTTALNLDGFEVSATVGRPGAGTSVYFAHQDYRCQRLGREIYATVTGKMYYWLSEAYTYNFYACTPSTHMRFPAGTVDRFIYSVPSSAALQKDIVVATALDAPYGKPVALNFTHPLARVTLSQGLVPYGRIVSVTFTGIIGSGEFDMTHGVWYMLTSDEETFTWECNAAADSGAALTDPDHNFFFIPQTLGPDAALIVAFEDAAGLIELHRTALRGRWEAGRHYNYRLTLVD